MKNLFITFLAASLFTACSKDNTPPPEPDKLPEATMVGANTAGCYINGRLIIPKNGINGISGSTSYGLDVFRGINFNNIPYGNDFFSIKFSNLQDIGPSYWIYIHLNNLTSGAVFYTLQQSNVQFFEDASNNPQIIVRETINNVSGKTFISTQNSGSIIITRFDFVNHVISGTFTASLQNQNNRTEIINVTFGRFDIRI